MNEFARLFAQSGLSLERLHTFLEVAEAGNIAKAAGSDPTRQSQFSRQVKELEGYFGLALTRRVGRRIEITNDGRRLATMIRQQLLDLDSFRESAAGRTLTLRIGASGSVIQWMLTPRLAPCRDALGGATLDIVQSRSAEVVRGVADGRLDFGIVRRDAVPDKKEANPLRPSNLVRGHRNQIRAGILNLDGQRRKGLDSVRMHDRPGVHLTDTTSDLVHRLAHTGLVVRHHHGDDRGFGVDCSGHIPRRDSAAPINGEDRHDLSVPFGESGRLEDSSVLDRSRDNRAVAGPG